MSIKLTRKRLGSFEIMTCLIYSKIYSCPCQTSSNIEFFQKKKKKMENVKTLVTGWLKLDYSI